MRTRRPILVLACSILSLLSAGACGGGGDGGSDNSDIELTGERPEVRRQQPSFVSDEKLDTFLDVEWGTDVTLVDSDQMDALSDYDWQNQTYTFDGDAVGSAGLELEAGRLLMMAGLALRRIESVDRSGGTVTVQTSPASLDEAIEDGEMGMDYETEFNEEMFRQSTMQFREMNVQDGTVTIGQPLDIEAESVSVSIEEDSATYEATVQNYTYKMEFSLEGDRFQTAFNVVKEGSDGATIRYGISGHVDSPKHRLRAEYDGGELSSYSYKSQGLSGELTLSIAAAGSGNDDTSFPLPSPIFEYPVLIGGVIPATIEFGALLAIQAQVPDASEASVQIDNTFEFGSDIGFALEDQTMTANSDVGSISLNDGSADLAANFTSVEASMSLGFPRIGVSVLNGTAAARLQTISTLKGELTFSPICQKADLSLAAEGAYDVSILGAIPVSSGKKTFFERDDQVLQKDCE